nr:unnamed protein product [Callosobruchus analis]
MPYKKWRTYKVQRNKLVLSDSFITDGHNSDLSSSGDDNIDIKLPQFETIYSLATENQILELKELIREQHNLIQMQNTKIEDLIVVVTNMSTQLKHLKLTDQNIVNDNITIVTLRAFPLKTIDEVKELEENLRNDENGSVKEFKSYLVQIGRATLKASIKWIIREIYSLDLQQKMNYSGWENKFPTKHLIQTKLILEVMQLNTKKTQVEAINEYMYHMQHESD